MKRKISAYGLGVFTKNQNVYLLYNSDKKDGKIRMDAAVDGFAFYPHKKDIVLTDENKKPLDISTTSDFRVSSVNKKYFLTFKVWNGEDAYIYSTSSSDLVKWKPVTQLKLGEGGVGMGKLTQTAMVVPEFSWKRKRVMYYGDDDIKIATSIDLTVWNPVETPVLSKRAGYFDNAPIQIASVFVSDKGIVVIYYVQAKVNGVDAYSVGSAIFDKNDPKKLIYRSDVPLLSNVEGLANKPVYPLGVINRSEMIVSYWDVEGEGVVAVAHPMTRKAGAEKTSTFKLVLEKLRNNPILKPIASHVWESKAVFNPAAIYENGKVHLIYRAVGDMDVSVLGYATSSDGITIDERLDEPIYLPRKAWEGLRGGGPGYAGLFASGSAYGGVEDPRITKVEDKYYMTYVAYDGWGPPRVALTSISSTDFNNRNWDQWKEPVLISRPGVVNKNACIFPEKVNGKYCIFHRIFPNMLIDYVDNLDFDGHTYLRGDAYIAPRSKMWDSRKIGVGAPPIKTKYGWLMIYQAVGDADPSRYKMGAMLLDLNDPAKVLFRSKHPILQPDQAYENEGLKYGVAYPCGAVNMNGNLMVYYGGADMVVCAAQAPMDDFLEQLVTTEEAELHTVKTLQLAAR
jgi:beta-1,2-mannobiose phosphorylase / 1,2-beta-oligomannan phosphorylase